MIYAIAAIASAILALPASAFDCEFGADCTGATCISHLDVCNFQEANTSYTAMGIPCGTVYDTDIACPASGAPIASGLFGFSLEALEGLKQVVSEVVPIGENNAVELSDPDNLDGYLLTTEIGQTLNATFIDEGACFRNNVGTIVWPADLIPDKDPNTYDAADRELVLSNGTMTIFFPNVDDFICQVGKDFVNCPNGDEAFCTVTTPYLPLGATVKIAPHASLSDYVFPPNTFVALFMVPDGFDLGISPGGGGYKEPTGTIHFSLETLNKADENRVGDSITTLVREAPANVSINGTSETVDFSDFVLFIFEDNINKDYQDVVVMVNKPIPAPSCGGILNNCGDICCPAICGVCGGCDVDCAALSLEKGVECCPGAIRESENFCDFFEEEECIVIGVDPCLGGNCDD